MKKKILALVMVVALLGVSLITGTLAYFTDTHTAENVFVVGNVDIELWEDNNDGKSNNGDPNGNNDEYTPWLKAQNLVPGVSIEKDAWIKNVGKNDAYVRVLVTVPANIEIKWDNTTDWEQTSKTTDASGNTVYTLEYIKVLTPATDTPDFMTAFEISEWIKNGEIADGKIVINAEAIQKGDFANRAEAFSKLDAQKLVDAGAEEAEDGILKTEDEQTKKVTYAITSKEGLMNLNSLLAEIKPGEGRVATVDLMVDIDLAGETWTPIQSMWVTFNGNGHTISNLNAVRDLTVDKVGRTGFWGYAGAVTINDLTLENVTSNGTQAGTFAGSGDGLKINNCYLKGNNTVIWEQNPAGSAYQESWSGIGAITGVTTTSNINVTITEGTTVTLVKNGIVTGAPYVDDLTGYIQANQGTVTNNGKIVTGAVVQVNSVSELADKLSGAGAAGAGYTFIEINGDMDLSGVTWTPIKVDGYHGADIITINGNGNTISNLSAPLFAGGFAGGSGIVINDLTIADSEMVDTANAYAETGYGAFVCAVDSMDVITLNNCHLLNSKVSGSRTGGLVGWTSGYNVTTDGPVDSYINILNCSVIGCEITGNGTVGAINGHAGCNPATYTTIKNCVVKNNTLISYDDSYRVGVVLGTANVGEVTIENITESGNTVQQIDNSVEIVRPAGQSNLYGRFVPGTTGKLTIDGVAVQ